MTAPTSRDGMGRFLADFRKYHMEARLAEIAARRAANTELVIWHEDSGTREIPMNELSSYERHTVEREKDGRLHGGHPF